MVALFTELDVLIDLICIGTLFVYYMVANALIMRRYVAMASQVSSATTTGFTCHGGTWPTAAFLLVITALSVAFVTIWRLDGDRTVELSICAAAIAVSSIVFKAVVPPGTTTTVSSSATWKAPMMPFVAVASIFLNVFLAGSLKALAFRRFGIWSAGALCFYVLYSVHAAHDADQTEATEKRSGNGMKEDHGSHGSSATATATAIMQDQRQQKQQQLQLVCV